MKRGAIVAVVLAALAVGVWAAFFRDSDEAKIRAALDRLASTVSVREGDANLVFRVHRIDRDFRELVDDEVRVSFPELPYVPSGRAELASMAADLPTVWQRAQFSFDSVTVKLDDARASASVGATATLVTPDRRESRSVDLLMRKEEGRWKIASVTVWQKDDR
jgi:hypothetical protein